LGREIELRPEIIGIIIGFLTLIYPLTYIFVDSISRDLFELLRNHNLNLNDPKVDTHIRKIHTFRYLFGFLMNIFLLTGIVFVITYIFYCMELYKWFIPLLVILLFSEGVLFFHEMFREKYKIDRKCYYLSIILLELIYVATVVLGIIFISKKILLCSQEAYTVFIIFGVLLVVVLISYFLIGLFVGSLRHVETLRYIDNNK